MTAHPAKPKAKGTKRKARRGERSGRPAFGRIQGIHDQLSRNQYPNCSSLAAHFEVDRKTVHRDIRYMRYQLHMPIDWDQTRNGYYYTAPVSRFPAARVPLGDLAALYLARFTLGSIERTLLGERVRGAFATMFRALRDEVRFSWSDLDRAFSVKAAAPKVSEVELFEKLGEALLDQMVVSFRYRKPGAATAERRLLEPYHLTQVDNCWYVIGRDQVRKALRTFSLQRMSHLRPTGTRFERPEDFDPRALTANAFGPWADLAHPQERRLVVIELSGYAAQMAQERRWHPSQKEEWLTKSGSRIRVTFEVNRLEDILRWTLSWGRHARVIAPEELVRMVRQEALAMAAG